MAFRQPTYHAPQRTYAPSPEETQLQQQAVPSQPLDASQEWILFSPSAASVTDRGYTTSTGRTQTAGHSRVSDFGSLDTAARSYDEASEYTEDALEEEDDDDAELDSLDSHLHEFRAEPSIYRGEGEGESSVPVLPTHDGLGSFRIDQAGMGDEIQQRLYAFEQFNPRRVKRRRESGELSLGLLEAESERVAEMERTRRVEEWRMEQSRVLVEEIQRESRRRKQSMSSERRSTILEKEQENDATLSNVGDSVSLDVDGPATENESFWNRITKRVIRDLMGIDDDLLSIIFGESLPADDNLTTIPLANSPVEAVNSIIARNNYEESSWEYRLLERIARELGILVNQLSDHPGAFSTYIKTQETLLPYAGLPVIPESARDFVPNFSHEIEESNITSPSVEFQPTLQHTQPLPIPIASTSLASPSLEEADATPRPINPLSQPITREEWEQDLDIKMVFRYLRSRFTRSFTPTSPPISHGTAHLATSSTAETAARVRQHHPLVTRERQQRVRTFRVSVPGKETMHVRRGSSGCGSERGVGKRTSGSSRHYWDLGHGGPGSVGSGSLITSTGGMGSWGEV